MNGEVLKAFTSILNFFYLAQLENATDRKLDLMHEHLLEFHANKHALTTAGVRDGPCMQGKFNIPKLEMLQHVPRFIREAGSMLQYSADQTERLHITMAKEPYRATNRKDFPEQMSRNVDRQDKVQLFTVFLEWLEGGDITEKFLPPKTYNAFLEDEVHTPRNDTTAFRLTDRISVGNIGIRLASLFYHLPKLNTLLSAYYHKNYPPGPSASGPRHRLPFEQLDTWQNMRLQLRSITDHGVVLPPTTLMAAPPSKKAHYGYCNFVLVKMLPHFAVPGIKGKGFSFLLRDS